MTRQEGLAMNEINIVGGGIAGLVAANACAEAGVQVTLREAHHTLGGRARTTAAPYIAHEGTHVFYSTGRPGGGSPSAGWSARRPGCPGARSKVCGCVATVPCE
jgi:NADPH-dependent 2,4-dienoyl-CoA reductase/sulfur reductase-like enzyme